MKTDTDKVLLRILEKPIIRYQGEVLREAKMENVKFGQIERRLLTAKGGYGG